MNGDAKEKKKENMMKILYVFNVGKPTTIFEFYDKWKEIANDETKNDHRLLSEMKGNMETLRKIYKSENMAYKYLWLEGDDCFIYKPALKNQDELTDSNIEKKWFGNPKQLYKKFGIPPKELNIPPDDFGIPKETEVSFIMDDCIDDSVKGDKIEFTPLKGKTRDESVWMLYQGGCIERISEGKYTINYFGLDPGEYKIIRMHNGEPTILVEKITIKTTKTKAAATNFSISIADFLLIILITSFQHIHQLKKY